MLSTYLSSRQTNNQVSDEVVFGLSGTMRHHGTPTVLFGQQMSLDRFGDTTNLVHLEEEAVASFLLDSGGYSLRIGDSQIVSYNLDWFGGKIV